MEFYAQLRVRWEEPVREKCMKATFDVQLQPKDLYCFNMYQTYTGMSGIVSVALGILAFVMAGIAYGKEDTAASYTILYIGMGLLFLFYVPVSLWFRAKSTLKSNAVLAGKLHYEVSEECIRVTQGEESGELPWDMVYKIVSTKSMVLIYSSRINAYIIPMEQIGEQYDALVEVATAKLEKIRLRLKKKA